jgi:hypothetical protein
MYKSLIAVVISLSLLAVAFAPAAAQDCVTQYTVVRGDNLYRIGLRFGLSWPVIAQVNNLANPNLIFAGQVLCIPAATFTPAPGTPTPTTAATPTVGPSPTPARTPTPGPTATPGATPTGFVIPTITIESVVRGQSVTIRTHNYPVNQTFTVLMGPLGTQGVGGIQSGTLQSGAGGSLTGTFNIPAELAGASAIAIRLQSPAGFFSYNWFYNTTTP